MTEQERPRTVETFVALWEVIQDRYARPAVRRIVEEALEAARTEGRQQHEHDPDACDDCMAMVEEAMRD